MVAKRILSYVVIGTIIAVGLCVIGAAVVAALPGFGLLPMPQIGSTAAAPPSSGDFTPVATFTGEGAGSSDLFALSAGVARVSWVYVGESNFSFSLKRLDNDQQVPMENTIGNADGQRIIAVDASNKYVFDVLFASGTWTITVDYQP